MAALTQARSLDLADMVPAAARSAIRMLLAKEPGATRSLYGPLIRKIWSLLVERRFDPEIRDWHALIHDLRTHIGTDEQISEQLTVLADLLRESVSFAETSPARAVANRPNARRILELLGKSDRFVARQTLMQTLGMRSANLSNTLTQLLAHNLVERRDKGKEAEFRISPLGRQLSGADGMAPPAPAVELRADVVALTHMLVREPVAVDTTPLKLNIIGFSTQMNANLAHGIVSMEDLLPPAAGRGSMSFTPQERPPVQAGMFAPVRLGHRTKRPGMHAQQY